MSCLDLRQQRLLPTARCSRFSNRNRFRYFFRAALFLGILTAGGGNSWAQTWISAVSASPTAGAAKVTWATAVPSDSQVEYGTTASYGNYRPGCSQGRDPLGRIEQFDRRNDVSLPGTFERREWRTGGRPGLCSYDIDPGYGLAFTPEH